MTGPEDGSAPVGVATVKITPAPVVSSGTRSWCGFSGGFGFAAFFCLELLMIAIGVVV